MRTVIIPALVAATAASTACSAAGEEVKISNVRAGLVCMKPELRNGRPAPSHICVETEKVDVTLQSVCVFDREEIPCTWHGYEFDYSGAGADTVLTCIGTTELPMVDGDPRGRDKAPTREVEYTLPLEAGSGHFFNPQYHSYWSADLGGETSVDETICSIGDRELFRVTFEHNFPPPPAG